MEERAWAKNFNSRLHFYTPSHATASIKLYLIWKDRSLKVFVFVKKSKFFSNYRNNFSDYFKYHVHFMHELFF